MNATEIDARASTRLVARGLVDANTLSVVRSYAEQQKRPLVHSLRDLHLVPTGDC